MGEHAQPSSIVGQRPRRVLVVNAGSSSLKFAWFDAGDDRASAAGEFHLHDKEAWLEVMLGQIAEGPRWQTDRQTFHADAVGRLLSTLNDHGLVFDAVGHRIVHGGTHFTAPVWLNAQVMADLEALTALAPLHQPPALHAIRAFFGAAPNVLQLAAFDTAFHASLPEPNRHFALPARLRAAGIVRYGFHGLAYASVAEQLAQLAPEIAAGSVVAAHLGSGVSLCAMQGGISRHTTLGFSTLDGVPMSTRCGALDPGVLMHLLGPAQMSLEAVNDLLYRESGLLGLSGISGDMRTLLASDAPEADFAVETFVRRVAEAAAAMACAAGGLDALIFSGGIGERSAAIRARVVKQLAFLGLALDAGANASDAREIHAATSRAPVLVIHADEQTIIARAVRETPGPHA